MKTNFLNRLTGWTVNRFSMLSIIGLLAITQATAQSASVSELLEQGIYSEETKGDLEAAMKAYRQVIADAKANESIAAQAQYRLGVCLYKTKNYTQATEAFEKLVSEHPGEKELVAKANEYLAGAATLLPAPWTSGEEQILVVRFPSGVKVGAASYTVDADQLDGRKIWRFSSRLFAGGIRQSSRIEVDAETFKPIHCEWSHSLVGDSETTYHPGHAEVVLKGKPAKTVELGTLVYDNEQAIQLMRRFPLAENYKTTMTVLSGLSGGNIIPVGIEVPKIESVTVPAGTFDCYRVELSLKQTFWFSTDEHRYLVKFEGGGVVAELTKVHTRSLTKPTVYTDPDIKFSLSVPAQWLFDRSDESTASKVAIAFLDETGRVFMRANAQGVQNLSAEERESAKAWAEKEIESGRKSLKEFKIRADGWQERKFAGHPATSVVADFVENQDKMVVYGVFLFAGDEAFKFVFQSSPEDFEKTRAKFDAMIDSLKLN